MSTADPEEKCPYCNRALSDSDLVQKIDLECKIRELHEVITKNFPIGQTEFDAWYTNRQYALERLVEIGQRIAVGLREEMGFDWNKGLSNELVRDLQEKGIPHKHWEDGPDGAIVGIAILVAGWIANQTARKSKHDPNDLAGHYFQKHIRPLIQASIELGTGQEK